MSVNTIRRTTVTDEALVAALWRIYREAFESSRLNAVQDQLCYDRKSFAEAMKDADYQKFVVFLDGEPVGIGLATNDMAKANVAYVNPVFLERRYPEDYAAGRLWYFTAIAVEPHLQGKGMFFASMAAEMTEFISERAGVVVFDYSLETNPELPKLLTTVIERAQQARNLGTTGTSFEPLGGQAYGMIRFLPRT